MNARIINQSFKYLIVVCIGAGILVGIYNSVNWPNSIKNPENDPYILECAFNLGIEPHEVTQRQFNQRYTK